MVQFVTENCGPLSPIIQVYFIQFSRKPKYRKTQMTTDIIFSSTFCSYTMNLDGTFVQPQKRAL